MMPMGLLAGGESGEIVSTNAVDALCATRAEDMGLRVGKRVQMLANGGPDVVVNVVDATNLERSLYLTVQLLELGVRWSSR